MGRITATVGAAAVFVAGIGIGSTVGDDPSGPGDPGGGQPRVLPDNVELAGALSSFEACDDYLGYVREHALERVTPHGLQGGGRPVPMPGAVEDSARARGGTTGDSAVDELGGTTGGAVGAPDVTGGQAAGDDAGSYAPSAGTTRAGVSGTNVQVQGVDEPDQLKTDGDVAYTTLDGQLRVLDITGDTPRELATLDLRDHGRAALLLADDRLLVTSAGGPVLPFAGEPLDRDTSRYAPHGATTTLTAVDVSDPADPVVEERLTLDGATLSSRMVDGVARVAIRTEAGLNLPWVHPEGSGLRAEREALQANRRLIENSDADDWLPYYVHETADGRETEGTLLSCEQVARPTDFSGLGTLSVLTVDVADGGLTPDDGAVGVLAGGDTVYASTDRLYIATRRTVDVERDEGDDAAGSRARPARPDGEVTTEIHAFDISDPSGTDYLASGEVPGVLLDQWALSHHDGVLRVASTVGERSRGGQDSESLVTTLERDGDELVQIGQVDDLGPTERIYAVRFIGEVGYVVTFRRTDPLYVLDVSDPTAPRVTGELKIPGYSAYLHPVGDGLLIGVGQDADPETGRTHGTQVSLFDVADPTDPRRIDTLTVEDSRSIVENNHRAFLHWAATGLNVVPVVRHHVAVVDEPTRGEPERPGEPPRERRAGPTSGALAFTASPDGFAPAGDGAPDEIALTHEPLDGDDGSDGPSSIAPRRHGDPIERSLVADGRLLTFSDQQVAVHDLDDLSRLGALELGRS